MNVYIAYGWPEGKQHGKKLVEALIGANYQITDSPEKAEIIIAHSAGCYMLPAILKAKLIILIGLPNWPDKPTIKCTIEKIRLERKDMNWFKKTFWHLFYLMTRPIRNYKVFSDYKRKYLPDFKQIILVHNRQDTYMNGS